MYIVYSKVSTLILSTFFDSEQKTCLRYRENSRQVSFRLLVDKIRVKIDKKIGLNYCIFNSWYFSGGGMEFFGLCFNPKNSELFNDEKDTCIVSVCQFPPIRCHVWTRLTNFRPVGMGENRGGENQLNFYHTEQIIRH